MAQEQLQQQLDQLNEFIVINGDTNEFEDQFNQVRQAAKLSLSIYNGNPDNLRHLNYDYIDDFVFINDNIRTEENNYEENIRPLLEQVPEAVRIQADRTVLNRWRYVLFKRDVTRRFLMACNYASDEQLRDGFDAHEDDRFPWRFIEVSRDLRRHLNGWLALIQYLLNELPTEEEFDEIRQSAQASFEHFKGWQFQHQQQNVDQYFGFINQFRDVSRRLEWNEYVIEDWFQYIRRMALEQGLLLYDEVNRYFYFSNALGKEQLNRLLHQTNWLANLIARRDQVKQFLVQGHYATEEQLRFGYDGQLPPRFANPDHPWDEQGFQLEELNFFQGLWGFFDDEEGEQPQEEQPQEEQPQEQPQEEQPQEEQPQEQPQEEQPQEEQPQEEQEFGVPEPHLEW